MLTLNDGRTELWQWDTGRTLSVDADCSQVHFSNKVFGRSIDVHVIDGAAIIPDVLLQTDKDLNAWAFVGTPENGYTKISKTFKVNRRNKPADYVFTPTDQMTLQTIQRQIGDLADLTTEAKDTLVAAINEAARSGGGAGSMELRVEDGYIQYSTDGGSTWQNLIAVAELKGADGTTPTIGSNGNWYIGAEDTGNPSRGETGAPGKDGADGKPGAAGANGVTPHIGDNGNWYLGETDTGKPSRGEDGATGATGATGSKGADGKTAYAYAVEGGYTGTETEFAAKLAAEKFANPNALTFTGAVTGSYDGSEAVSVEIPSGGGDKNWTKVIDTEVTTEEGLFSFEATDIGAYSEFFVSMKLPAQTASPLKIKVGNTYILQDNQGINASKTTYWECYGIYDGEAWHVEYANGISGEKITFYANTRLICKQVVSEASTAIAVTVNTSTQAFAKGTTCRVVIR